MRDIHTVPADLPVPADDGAANHLTGALLPELALPCTDGTERLLSELPAPTVLFFYPRTGVPGQAPLPGEHGETWESIPGARGCTPQSCSFRDLHAEFAALGVAVLGVSTQTPEFQQAFAERNHIPFAFLSDAHLNLTRALRLPTFTFPVASGGPARLIKRMCWFVFKGRIEKVWYPVFPPQENAARVLSWLQIQLPYFTGISHQSVVIAREAVVDAAEIGSLYAASGIRRPDQDHLRLATMFGQSNLVVTARRDGRLVGVARSFVDGAWTCYVCDLAVDLAEQRAGIGKALLAAVQAIAGPQCSIVLSAGRGAEDYYAKVGFAPIPSAWFIGRNQ